MAPSENADKIVSDLIDACCERRALKALRILLPAWPHNGLTDGVADLADALRGVRARAKNELTADEVSRLSTALGIYDRAVHER